MGQGVAYPWVGQPEEQGVKLGCIHYATSNSLSLGHTALIWAAAPCSDLRLLNSWPLALPFIPLPCGGFNWVGYSSGLLVSDQIRIASLIIVVNKNHGF